MATLTAAARGQVTFRKDVLQHLGVRPGGKVHLDLLPDGRAALTAEKPKGSFRELHEFLNGKTNGARLSIEQISDAIAESCPATGSALYGSPCKSIFRLCSASVEQELRQLGELP